MTRILTSVLFALAAGICLAVAADESKVEEVLGGLTNPCGIAIQPETGHVFVSDSAAGR